MNRDDFKQLADSIGRTVLQQIRELKKDGREDPWHIPVTLFLADKDFDVKLRISLVDKKTQKQIGESMFGVQAGSDGTD